MHFRPSIEESFTLKQRFSGTGRLGAREFWVQTGNYLDFEGGRNHLHRHSYYEACLVLDGKGRFLYGDREYKVGKGDLFIADPGVVHEIVSHSGDHLKIQFLAFSFEDTDSLNETLQDSSIRVFLKDHRIHIKGCGKMETLFKLLKDASLDPDPMQRQIRNTSLISLIIQEIILASVEEYDENPSELFTDTRIQNAIQYMTDNVFRRLTVEEIAFHAGTSTRSLRRLISEKYGMTVAQKSFSLRIESSARYLVSHPEQSVAQVSVIYGFENPSDFCRGFKKVTGSSPGRYRKNKGTTFIN